MTEVRVHHDEAAEDDHEESEHGHDVEDSHGGDEIEP